MSALQRIGRNVDQVTDNAHNDWRAPFKEKCALQADAFVSSMCVLMLTGLASLACVGGAVEAAPGFCGDVAPKQE